MKVTKAKANTKDGMHFTVHHDDDGRTTPVSVSTINLLPIAKKMGYAGNDLTEAAQHIARTQADANFAQQDKQKAEAAIVRESNGTVAKPKRRKAKAAT